jgi:hypothetical protein
MEHSYLGMKVGPSEYCPTREYVPLKGWRKFMRRWFRVPLSKFKREKFRVMYKIDNETVVCSYENMAFMLKTGADKVTIK